LGEGGKKVQLSAREPKVRRHGLITQYARKKIADKRKGLSAKNLFEDA